MFTHFPQVWTCFGNPWTVPRLAMVIMMINIKYLVKAGRKGAAVRKYQQRRSPLRIHLSQRARCCWESRRTTMVGLPLCLSLSLSGLFFSFCSFLSRKIPTTTAGSSSAAVAKKQNDNRQQTCWELGVPLVGWVDFGCRREITSARGRRRRKPRQEDLVTRTHSTHSSEHLFLDSRTRNSELLRWRALLITEAHLQVKRANLSAPPLPPPLSLSLSLAPLCCVGLVN